jgi:RimJ/RimL family protein N-acetyltransferase
VARATQILDFCWALGGAVLRYEWAMFEFRALTWADLPLLHEWLNRPHVAEWWQSPSCLDDVLREYGAELDSQVTRAYLACLDREPIAFIQSYEVMRADPAWWQDETDPGSRGIDQFLANAQQLNQGLGSKMIAEFLPRLWADPAVTKVQTDPSPDNRRAIRAYEKVGFKRVRELTTPDGPALLMVVER